MKRKILGIISILIIGLVAVGCGAVEQGSSIDRENAAVEDQQKHLLDLYPVPYFDTSQERSIMIQLYQLRNDARITHSVIVSDGTGTPKFDCPSIGFPIANDVQLTNPDVVIGNNQGGFTTIAQPEPNGLFSADSSWGTWVMCAEGDGQIAPIYNEAVTITFPFPVTVDYTTGRITRVAGSEAATVDPE
jgi:hypothetical protein